MPNQKLEPGNFYHIYNRGINSCNLFEDNENYRYFLKLYNKYINPIAHTYAWVLMPNHFHILIFIKENVIYKYPKDVINNLNEINNIKTFEDIELDVNKWLTIPKPDSVNDLSAFEDKKTPNPTSHFSHLFNSYTKAFNKSHQRHGSLFERAFKRKLIDTNEYLRQTVIYIHNNPIHHSFVSHPIEYPWSSYITCLSEKKSQLKREEVIQLFTNHNHFIKCHQTPTNLNDELFL